MVGWLSPLRGRAGLGGDGPAHDEKMTQVLGRTGIATNFDGGHSAVV